jgi:hypothetical protein
MKNQITFSNVTAQINYFSSKTLHTESDIIYIKKDDCIRSGIHADIMNTCNYVMYNNNGKWYYAFIKKVKYVNEGLSLVYLETDPYQTWLFDFTIMDSFVVREHVTNDYIGEHLVEEGLETGEYKNKSVERCSALGELWYVVGYSDTVSKVFGGKYSNVYSGLRYKAFSSFFPDTLTDFIKSFDLNGQGTAITIIFTIPKLFLPADIVNGEDIAYNLAPQFTTYDVVMDRTNIDGYTPKNKKMFTYPYTFLYVSNNNGQSAIFRLEDFTDFGTSEGVVGSDRPRFYIGGNVAPSPKGFCVPWHYKGVEYNWDESLTIEGFPLCSWNNDVYANWVAQNSNSIWMNSAVSTGTAIAGLFTGNAPAVLTGVNGVMSQLGTVYQHSIQPDQARGSINNGSLNCATGQNTFFFYQKTIKREFAEKIDKFFDIFGYKVNTVKKPNTNTRPHWNYVQTIDINIKAGIPQTDLNRIKEMFNSGVTLWHSGDSVGDYSLNNH